MSKAGETINVSRVRERLEKMMIARANFTSAQSREFSFHMTDWLDDMEALRMSFAAANEVDDEYLFSAVLNFLLHTPGHLISAATAMTGETPADLIAGV